MPSRYPTAPTSYDPKQLDQLVRTLLIDLGRLEQPFGLGYNVGGFAPSPILMGGGATYATGLVGTVTVVTNGSTSVSVNSGSSADAYNVGQVLSALITDLKIRGLLG
jgi:hypothetical protein